MTKNCRIDCDECLLSSKYNGRNINCFPFESFYSDEAIKIVEKWEKEHPIMTNAEKYEQMMKNLLGDDFEIGICTSKSYNVPFCACEKMNTCSKCVKFWNSKYKEKE